MKKLTTLLLVMIITISSFAQEIVLDLKVTLGGNKVNDSTITVLINDISDSIKTFEPIDNLTIHLKPNTEYLLIFSKDGYDSKIIYVFTSDMPPNAGKYWINSVVDLKKGYKTTLIKAGSIWYDTSIKSFQWHITNARLIKPANLLTYIK